MATYRLLLLPGDGIGPEVMAEVKKLIGFMNDHGLGRFETADRGSLVSQDLGLLADYVGSARRYHHTAPITMLYGLHAGLGVVLDEGLDAAHARHRHVGGLLQDALPDLGFRPFALERHLPQLTSLPRLAMRSTRSTLAWPGTRASPLAT